MKNSIAALISLVVLGLPTVSFAADWSAAFPTDAVATYVPSQSTKVMVVSVDAPDATKALVDSIVDSAVVVPGSALGNVSELGDAEIVERAASQPVDQIAIVRRAGSSDNPIAVVTIYTKDGKSAGGFTASEASPAPPSDGGGASQSEIASATEESKAAAPATSEAQEEFLESYVAFEDWVGVNQYGAVVSSWSVPYKGQYREPLKGAAFYEYIEHPDLAAKYRKRNRTRWIIYGSSAVLILGGVAVAIIPVLSNDVSDGLNLTPLIAGISMVTVGSLGSVVAGAINPHPVEPSEARRLAADFNKKLAERLGVDIRNFRQRSQRGRPLDSLKLGVVPVRGGVMAGARVRF